jgi:hypothetical protein
VVVTHVQDTEHLDDRMMDPLPEREREPFKNVKRRVENFEKVQKGAKTASPVPNGSKMPHELWHLLKLEIHASK